MTPSNKIKHLHNPNNLNNKEIIGLKNNVSREKISFKILSEKRQEINNSLTKDKLWNYIYKILFFTEPKLKNIIDIDFNWIFTWEKESRNKFEYAISNFSNMIFKNITDWKISTVLALDLIFDFKENIRDLIQEWLDWWLSDPEIISIEKHTKILSKYTDINDHIPRYDIHIVWEIDLKISDTLTKHWASAGQVDLISTDILKLIKNNNLKIKDIDQAINKSILAWEKILTILKNKAYKLNYNLDFKECRKDINNIIRKVFL